MAPSAIKPSVDQSNPPERRLAANPERGPSALSIHGSDGFPHIDMLNGGMTIGIHRAAPLFVLLFAVPLGAQSTQTVQDTATAYGARLTIPGDPTKPLNTKRVNNRVESRISNRIALRIEKYRVGSSADPLATVRQNAATAMDAYARAQDAGRQRDLSPAQSVQQPEQDPYAESALYPGQTSPRR